MIIRAIPLSLALALAMPLAAQGKTTEASSQNTAAMFYRAFYLDKGENRHQEAIDLYGKFLAAAPTHRYAGKAADGMIKLLNRVGKVEEAQKARTKYAAVLKNVRGGNPPVARGGRGQGGRGQGGRGRGQGGRGRGGFGGRGRGRGGFNQRKITEMSEDELDSLVERMNRMAEFMIARMEDNGQEAEAKKLEKQIDTLVKAIDEGKKDDAQKVYDEMMQSMRGGRGRGGFGGRGRGGRGGRGQGGRGRGRGGRNLRLPEGLEPPLAKLDDETRKKKINFLVDWATNQARTSARSGQQDAAEKLEGQVAEFKKLVEKKDWKAADELVDKVMKDLSGGGNQRGRGRGGRGGDQQGGRRRRRGGDGGGQGGDTRRRRRGGETSNASGEAKKKDAKKKKVRID